MRNHGNNGLFPLNQVKPSMENIARVTRTLDEILVSKDLLNSAMTKEELSALWRVYHETLYCVAAVIEPYQYERLRSRWEKYPVFLIPCPKGKGTEFYVFQFEGHCASYVKLQLYQAYQAQDDIANTPKALQLMYYCEFLDTKDVVLMRGQIDPQQIDVHEATLLVGQTQLFYLDNSRYEMVKKFNENPQAFDYHDLLNF